MKAVNFVKTGINSLLRKGRNSQINGRADDAAEKAAGAANKVSIAAGGAAGDVAVLKGKVDTYQSQVDEWTKNMKLAQKKGDTELAKKAAKKVINAQKRLGEVTGLYNDAKANFDNYKEVAADARDDAEDAAFRADSIKTRNNMANSKGEMIDALHGVNGTGTDSSLDELDNLVKRKEAKNDTLEELSGRSDEAKFEKMREEEAIQALLNGGASSEPAPADAGVEAIIK